MNIYLDQVKTAMRAKLIPYGVMLDYQYKNLCVKTSTEALLPIEVKKNNTEVTLEAVAKVGIVDDEHFQIAPFDASFTTAICEGIFKTHPQLKQEVIDPLDSPYASEETKAKVRELNKMMSEQIGEQPSTLQLIILTTPEVNDKMKKLLLESVDMMLKQCEVLFQKELTEAKANIAYAMSEQDPQDLKKANDELNEEYGKHWGSVQESTEQIRQDIEEANKRYHERHHQEEFKEHGGMSAEEDAKVHSMKFGEYEE